MNKKQLVEAYARAIREHSASVFVGAGLSIPAGYPNWDTLIETIKETARVPDSVTDAPLAAQYAVNELSEDYFHKLLLEKFNGVVDKGVPSSLKALMDLPLSEYWTTNYDTLLERAGDAYKTTRIVADKGYSLPIDPAAEKRITKMHGSLTLGPIKDAKWESDVVITRSDYEAYEVSHPLIWAQLRALFLTTSFLFLGFSFDDPNVGVLLRLSRSLNPGLARREHYALMRRPTEEDEGRAFDLRVEDLRTSGIHVGVITDYAEIGEILNDLTRRAKQPNVFVSGSWEDPIAEEAKKFGEHIGARLYDLNLQMSSFAGPAGRAVAQGMYQAMRAVDKYDAAKIQFFFRRQDGKEAPVLPRRMGSAFYTEMTEEAMRDSVLAQSTAMIVIGGGARTAKEVERALSLGIPVIPVGIAGGLGKKLLDEKKPSDLGLEDAGASEWSSLSKDSVSVATAVQSIIQLTT